MTTTTQTTSTVTQRDAILVGLLSFLGCIGINKFNVQEQLNLTNEETEKFLNEMSTLEGKFKNDSFSEEDFKNEFRKLIVNQPDA